MTSSSASDHRNPAGIAALMQKGTTSKGMEADKNFAKWLSCGIQISGTFGLHHVYSSVTVVSLRFHSRKEKFDAFLLLLSVLMLLFQLFYCFKNCVT
jgi:hypothetical protein